MLDLPHVASRVFGTPLMIARAKLEVILGVLAPRFAGGPVEPVDPTTDPAPLTSITVERIAVVSVIGTLVSRSGYLDADKRPPVVRRHRRRDCFRHGRSVSARDHPRR